MGGRRRIPPAPALHPHAPILWIRPLPAAAALPPKAVKAQPRRRSFILGSAGSGISKAESSGRLGGARLPPNSWGEGWAPPAIPSGPGLPALFHWPPHTCSPPNAPASSTVAPPATSPVKRAFRGQDEG